ncbi:MAG: hypothetical protein HY088_01255 [Ignavibacteriales bacterium]|nr:hypothetical protein [Ignavibacteriales bacterium]
MLKTASNLYLLNATLLITHEIDSAYWKEWELFGIPGGIQLFLILNFLLLLAFLFGYKQLLLGTKSGYIFSLALAFGGIFAFVIHTYFILAGHAEFTPPISLVILIATLIVSLAQGLVALKSLRT